MLYVLKILYFMHLCMTIKPFSFYITYYDYFVSRTGISRMFILRQMLRVYVYMSLTLFYFVVTCIFVSIFVPLVTSGSTWKSTIFVHHIFR